MKKFKLYMIIAAAVLTGALSSCHSEYIIYDGPEYIMFQDTLLSYPVMEGDEYFEVPVVSTVIKDYDRTIAVEIIDKGSNAIENYHYALKSNSVTIKAGETRGNVYVKGIYENIEPSDSLGFTLSLVMNDNLIMEEETVQTKVTLWKSCPFVFENFQGWCVVTSMFLYDYSSSGWYQRVVKTEKHPTEPNTIICYSWLFDGYHVTMKFHPEDPENPTVTMDADQVISDEGTIFGISYGDDHILASTTDMYPSYFYSCLNAVTLYSHIYVEDLGAAYGTVGYFYNTMEWVSDEEAKRLHEQEGMPMGFVPVK